MFLEDCNWESATVYGDRVLDIDPHNVNAYLVKLMANYHVRKKEYLKELCDSFDSNCNFQKILSFGDNALVSELNSYLETAKENEAKKYYTITF